LQIAAAQEILQSLDPADPRTAHRLTSHTSTYKQTSVIISRKDRVSARIDEIGVKTEKLALKQGFKGLSAKDLDLKGPKTKNPGLDCN
jgi:hypothetical protein